MEENLVAPPRRAFIRVGSNTLIPIPHQTPTYQRFELEMHHLLRRVPNPPATLESIESLEVVIVSKQDQKEGGVCTICLDEWEHGDVVKELPCRHRYHGWCIKTWLETSGICPVCRYRMPVDYEKMVMKNRWLKENMSENLDRFLMMNTGWRHRIVYVDEAIVPLGAQVRRLGDN